MLQNKEIWMDFLKKYHDDTGISLYNSKFSINPKPYYIDWICCKRCRKHINKFTITYDLPKCENFYWEKGIICGNEIMKEVIDLLYTKDIEDTTTMKELIKVADAQKLTQERKLKINKRQLEKNNLMRERKVKEKKIYIDKNVLNKIDHVQFN